MSATWTLLYSAGEVLIVWTG